MKVTIDELKERAKNHTEEGLEVKGIFLANSIKSKKRANAFEFSF